MTSPKTKQPKWRPGLVVEPGLSPVAAAVSLAMRLLTEGGAPTWSALTDPQDSAYRDKALSKVSLTSDQGALLDAHADVLTWIVKMPDPDGKTITTTIAICPTCKQYTIVAGAVPSACKVSSACRTGAEAADKDGKVAYKPVKVKPATRQKDPEDALNTPDLDVALAPVVESVQEEAGRETPEVLDDGMIRPTVFVFGDIVEDDEDEEPTPKPVAPAIVETPREVEVHPTPQDVPVPAEEVFYPPLEEPPSYVYDDVPPPPDDYYDAPYDDYAPAEAPPAPDTFEQVAPESDMTAPAVITDGDIEVFVDTSSSEMYSDF